MRFASMALIEPLDSQSIRLFQLNDIAVTMTGSWEKRWLPPAAKTKNCCCNTATLYNTELTLEMFGVC